MRSISMRAVAGCLVGTLVLVLTATAMAQPEPGGQGRGPGGRRGQGMMGPMGGGMGYMMLLQNPEVQKEIELTEEQQQQLAELRPQGRPGAGGPPGEAGERPDPEQMRARMEEMQKKIEEVLLPHQVARLKQITLQMQGAQALMTPDVAKELEITDEQKTQIREVMQSQREKMREMFQPGGDVSQEERMTKMREMREEMNKEVLAVLTADQQKKFEEMQGEKFDTSVLMRGFGGPGMREGGAQGGRRGGQGNRQGGQGNRQGGRRNRAGNGDGAGDAAPAE